MSSNVLKSPTLWCFLLIISDNEALRDQKQTLNLSLSSRVCKQTKTQSKQRLFSHSNRVHVEIQQPPMSETILPVCADWGIHNWIWGRHRPKIRACDEEGGGCIFFTEDWEETSKALLWTFLLLPLPSRGFTQAVCLFRGSVAFFVCESLWPQ